MAKVYAPARAESCHSESTSSRFTPASSKGTSRWAAPRKESSFNSQPFSSQVPTNYDVPLHRGPAVCPQVTQPSSYLNNLDGVQFNASRYQASQPPSFNQYCISPRAPYPNGYAVPAYPPYILHGVNGIQPHSQQHPYFTHQLGLMPQSSIPSAQLEFEAQTEHDAKRIMTNKIVDELMKLNLDRDQVLATGAALLSGLKSSEAAYHNPPPAFQASNSGPTDGKREHVVREQTVMYSDVGETIQDGKGGIWDSPNNNDGWNSVHDNNDSSWKAHDNYDDMPDCPSTLLSPKFEAPQLWTNSNTIADVQQRCTAADTRPSAVPAAKESSNAWSQNEAPRSSYSESEYVEESVAKPAGKFTDPCLIHVNLVAGWDDWGADLFVPKATLMKLFHHADFRYRRVAIGSNPQVTIQLPSVRDSSVEAFKEILYLLEMDTEKQELLCYSNLAPGLHAYMYATAVKFHLHTIAQALLDSIHGWSKPFNDYVTTVKIVYESGIADDRFKAQFKTQLRNHIASFSEASGCWDAIADREFIKEGLSKMKFALMGIENQTMKTDAYEVLVDYLSADASKKSPEYDTLLEVSKTTPQTGVRDFHGDGEASCVDDAKDDCDSRAESLWEGFSDDETPPPRAPTPDNWNVGPQRPSLRDRIAGEDCGTSHW